MEGSEVKVEVQKMAIPFVLFGSQFVVNRNIEIAVAYKVIKQIILIYRRVSFFILVL